MNSIKENATLRLIGRAAIAGLMAGLAAWQASGGGTTEDVLYGALGAAVLAAAEVFTPLNVLVGLFKKPAAQ